LGNQSTEKDKHKMLEMAYLPAASSMLRNYAVLHPDGQLSLPSSSQPNVSEPVAAARTSVRSFFLPCAGPRGYFLIS